MYKKAATCHFFTLIYADGKAAGMVIVMKIFKKHIGITLCIVLLTFVFQSIPVSASQSGTEVAVIVRFIDYATKDEVYVGTRGTDGNGNSVLYPSEFFIFSSWEEARDAEMPATDKSCAPAASFQVNNGEKTSVNWTEGGEGKWPSSEGDNDEIFSVSYIRGGHYYGDNETSAWTADTTITVSDVEIPVGYTEVEESGTYTVVFGEENCARVQGILNGTIEDTNEAIYIYIDVIISDGTEPAAEPDLEEEILAESEEANDAEAANETAENSENEYVLVSEPDTETVVAAESVEESNNAFPSYVIPVGIAVVIIAAALILYFQRKKADR
ncbi:MAG: hypothetical protein LUC06_06845 [Oscillospiraceae bacterium]|nr:hypothetical protein [Oscillospiraceae bacterium]